MLDKISSFHIDLVSFLSGFLFALLLVAVLYRLRHYLPQAKTSFNNRLARSNKRTISGLFEKINKETLKRTQSNHLAATLFSLDEIVIPPRVVLPLAFANPDDPSSYEDTIHTILPYTPDWPELTGHLAIPTLSLVEALQGNTNVALIGQPGSGKTVALSWLASRIVLGDLQLGTLGDLIPIYINVNDLQISGEKSKDAEGQILAVMRSLLPALTSTQTMTLIKREMIEGHVLILVDGADELSPSRLKDLTKFLGAYLREFPKTRLVLSTSPDYLDGLTSLNFFPLALAAWDQSQCHQFVDHWAVLWTEFVKPIQSGRSESQEIDPLLVTSWLSNEIDFLTPLELTLKTWAAFAGDSFGNSSTDSLDSLMRRNITDARLLPAFEEIALEMLNSQQLALPQDQVEKSIVEKNTNYGDLAGIGLFSKSFTNKISFIHPVIMGYLAGQALKDPQRITALGKQPLWLGKRLSMQYLATCVDLSDQVNSLLAEDSHSLLFSNLFFISRWIREVPAKTAWRSLVMRRLVEIIKQDAFPFYIRIRALAAFLVSNDPSIVLLLRQLLIVNHASTRQLAVLGCGALQDKKSTNDLEGLLTDPDPNVRSAAGIALASFDDANCLGRLKEALMQGDESLGRIVAIALAARKPGGQDTLREWSKDGNLLIRRFCVFGLEMVTDKWSEELLTKMSIEEGEWVVRNAAAQALENRQKLNPHIPRSLPDPHNVPWLIAFASTQGKGVALSQTVTPLLISALESGNSEERQASLNYLSLISEPDPGVILTIYRIAFNEKGLIKETAFNALWMMAIHGVFLPSPLEYGIAIPQFS